jgi:PAS domain S-box-containing protein
MDYKISFIAPFPHMARIAEALVTERADEWKSKIQISHGDSREGVKQAREAVNRDAAEVIISRGGTALAIAENVAVPVVQIPVTAIDILRAIKQVGVSPEHIGVAGFRNVIYECETLIELLGLSIRIIMLENEAETADKIAYAASQGVQVVIGDVNAVTCARQMGLGGYTIESGKEAIYKAIKEAELVVEVRRREQERSALLQTIINSTTDGIVAVDKAGLITFFNPAAGEVFHLSQAEVIGRKINEVIPNTRLSLTLANGMPEIGEIQHIGRKVIATKRIPIKLEGSVVGAIANFQDVTQLQHFEQTIRQKLYAKGLVAKAGLDDIIGSSSVLEAIKQQARRFASSRSTVLITGESGTGKEMFAQSIHKLSSRNQGPFVAINCAALPESLLESELLGYEEGAFTGAKKGGKLGLFELAHGGTLFLDEVGELPLTLQARLLRVLQEKEVMRLGGHRVIPIDVRIIAATNQNLTDLVGKKQFRADLFYRLVILHLHLPPLRERTEDIPLLAEHFLRSLSDGAPQVKKLKKDALAYLQRLYWQGNIRELAIILERALLLTDAEAIGVADIKSVLISEEPLDYSVSADDDTGLEELERERIMQVLHEENFNYTRAAKRLGIGRTTLWRKKKKIDESP